MYDFEILLYSNKKVNVPADEVFYTPDEKLILLKTNNEVIASFNRTLVAYVIRH